MATTRGQHLIGKVLGSCVLEKLLGYGGSSAVFLAQQQTPQRKVAVKVFLPRTGMDSQMQRNFYQRFLREAKAASELEHAHILPIYAYGEQDGLPYIVMPYMSGGTLAEYMEKRGPLSLQETQWYLSQLAEALDYAHEQGCVHCDVKPANILLDSDGYVMLSDFGIARLIRSGNDVRSARLKSEESLLGTPDYISPEQALGKLLDGRSDIYSLGITLFFVLGKQLPFRADSPIALALLHVHEPPPSLASMRADITPELDKVISKALAKNPDDRFQSARELSTAFAAALAMGENKQAVARNKYIHLLNEEIFSGDIPVVHAVSRPFVHIKPFFERHRDAKRLLIIGVACIFVLSTIGLTVNYVTTTRSHQAAIVVRPTASSIVKAANIAQDQLTNTRNWPLSSTFFYDTQQQSYHIVNKLPVGVALAPYYNHQFRDFRLTITVVEVQKSKGLDYYGVVFRAAPDQSHYYLFEIAPADHAHYSCWRFDSGRWTLIRSGSIASLVTEVGKSNTLSIEAHGNNFTIIVNGKSLGATITDSNARPLQVGQIGLYVENQGMEVAFSHLYIDSLK